MKIIIEGWEGLNKVSMDRAIRDNSPLSLKESKALTDRLLDVGFVEFETDNKWQTAELLSALKDSNANVLCQP